MLVHLELYESIVGSYGAGRQFFTDGWPLRSFLRQDMVDYLVAKKEEDPFSINIKLDNSSFSKLTDFSLMPFKNPKLYEDNLDKDPLVRDVVDLLVFKKAMESSRKLWMPQAGQGSHESDNDVVKLINKFDLWQEEKKICGSKYYIINES